jgi:hypothetical protein
MIIVAAVAVVVVSVPLFGGNLGALATLRVRQAWAAMAAIALQVVIISVFEKVIPHALGSALHLVSYGLAGWFVVANRRIRGLWVVALGGMLNVAAIVANDGVMPASNAAMHAAGIATKPYEFVNSGTVSHPKLAFLGDLFAWPKPLPLANVFSIGDVLLTVGIGIVLHRACRSRLSRRPLASARGRGPQ